MSEKKASLCPQCGQPLPADAPAGLCPVCLMAMNLATHTDIPEATAPSPRAVPPPPAPETIAPYFPQLEIIRCLGRGGMGVVYEARQKSLNRLVALKILAPEREKDAAFGQRFATEAEILARLNHPNIITIHDFGTANGMFYLVMEYVDGVNLRQLLRTRKLTPEEALAVVPPLCDALQFAHERGIVHRDIKPENILLDKTGRVKIADFGIAKMLGPVSEELSREKSPPENVTQNIVGTRGYSAPEQQQTPKLVDSRADIYSLGVVFYEMLTGELPGKKIEPPSQKVQVDVRLDEIVLRALAEKPELRFQQASVFKTQVETILTSQPASGGGNNTTPRPTGKSWFGSFPSWATKLLGMLLLLAALTMLFELIVNWHDQPVALGLATAWVFLLGSAWLGRGRLLGKICGWAGAIFFVPLILIVLFLSVKMTTPTEPGVWKLPASQGPQPIPLAPGPQPSLPPAATDTNNPAPSAAIRPTAVYQWFLGSNVLAPTTDLAFGPVVEQVLNDASVNRQNSAIDLDTGNLITPPAELSQGTTEQATNWAATHGLDAYAVVEPEAASATGAENRAKLIFDQTGVRLPPGRLTGLGWDDAAVMLVANSKWADLTAIEVKSALLNLPLQPWAYLPGQTNEAVTCLFKTREGALGILQITGIAENPRSVAVRYKLAQGTTYTRPPAANEVAHLKLSAAEQDLENIRKRVEVGLAPLLDLDRAQFARDIAAAELNGDPAKVAQLKWQAAELEFKIAGQLHAVGSMTDADFQKAQAAYNLARAEFHPNRPAKTEPQPEPTTPTSDQPPEPVVDEAPTTTDATDTFQFRWVADDNDTNTPVDALSNDSDASGQQTLRVQRRVILSGRDVESAGLSQYQSDQKTVEVFLSRRGGEKFAAATAANVGRQLAIVWQGRVLSTPVVRTAIPGRHVSIAGRFTDAQAQELLSVLNHRPVEVSPAPAVLAPDPQEIQRQAEAEIKARLSAAVGIINFTEQDKMLAKIAKDAAAIGDAGDTRTALNKITNFSTRDQATIEAARQLVKTGQRTEAIALAQIITSFTSRDALLKELAQ